MTRDVHIPTSQVHWLLEHLKLYEFTGVQMTVNITSSTYLTPAEEVPQQLAQPSGTGGSDAAGDSRGGSGRVLSGHRARIAAYLQAGAELAAATGRGGSGEHEDAEVR